MAKPKTRWQRNIYLNKEELALLEQFKKAWSKNASEVFRKLLRDMDMAERLGKVKENEYSSKKIEAQESGEI